MKTSDGGKINYGGAVSSERTRDHTQGRGAPGKAGICRRLFSGSRAVIRMGGLHGG